MRGANFLMFVMLIIGAVVFWGISMYNRLVKKRNHVEDGWSGIDVQLKRRHDLIPNIVNVVKKYAEHEQETLEKVIHLRNAAQGRHTPGQQSEDEQKLSHALSGLMVQVEAYPDLKANSNFIDLQQQLQKVEDDIQYARRYYNGAVREYNTAVQSFPSNMVANKYDFREAEFFELENPKHAENPEVNL
ncbi:LemA family protein [Marinicella litoralis]|uniref:LemA protein n=1 Tax=Marinicella litoralis TaxID=644220 RepID=A0A4R6XGB6_9GAMM|nr:LemA family protein [Marinicella litoralis]TDR16317.1 LemA protein [Marinicella litoralis]